MNNVACVWIPPKYNISYVEILYNSVKRNSEKPFNFYCLTTHPQDITNPNIIPIALEVDPMFDSDTKKWWYKCNLFNKHNWEGQVLYVTVYRSSSLATFPPTLSTVTLKLLFSFLQLIHV